MLTTRLTEGLGLRHPIISAPTAFAAGGRLAAAVSWLGVSASLVADTAMLIGSHRSSDAKNRTPR